MQLTITHYVPAFLLPLWRILFCRHNWHAWDEVYSAGDYGIDHHLVCDACGKVLPLKELP